MFWAFFFKGSVYEYIQHNKLFGPCGCLILLSQQGLHCPWCEVGATCDISQFHQIWIESRYLSWYNVVCLRLENRSQMETKQCWSHCHVYVVVCRGMQKPAKQIHEYSLGHWSVYLIRKKFCVCIPTLDVDFWCLVYGSNIQQWFTFCVTEVTLKFHTLIECKHSCTPSVSYRWVCMRKCLCRKEKVGFLHTSLGKTFIRFYLMVSGPKLCVFRKVNCK